MSEHALTIVGGGLAGLSLGIGLRRRGVAVTLHEAGAYPRHRVCGEFLRGVSGQTLEALGIRACFADARTHRETAWFGGSGALLMASALPEPALGISRFRLDERLARRFEELGGALRVNSRRRPEENAEGWVWTAGRRPAKSARWLGLKLHCSGLAMQSDLEMHLGHGGYVGLAGVEDGRVNVCGLFRIRPDASGRGASLLFDYLRKCGLHALAERLRHASPDEASFTGVSAFRLGSQRGDAGRCVLGDAERMIPPFTGNGMSMAFESAECALGPLADFAQGKFAWDACRPAIAAALATRFRGRVAAARLMHPWLIGNKLPRFTSGLMRARLVPFSLLTRLVS